jgi:hypothetical protein
MILISSEYQAVRTTPDALITVEHLQALSSGFLIAAALIAVVTLALLQLVKPFARGLIHWRTARSWLQDEERLSFVDISKSIHPSERVPRPRWVRELRKTGLWVPRPEFEDAPPGGVFGGRFTGSTTSTQYFMRGIQNVVSAVMQSPSTYLGAFALLTRRAPREVQATLLWADLFRRFGGDTFLEENDGNDRSREGAAVDEGAFEHPRAEERRRAKDTASHAIAAAQDIVEAEVERSLDALQLKLVARWQTASRCVTLSVGLALAMTASWVSGSLSAVTFAVGLTGGAIAAMLDESAGSILANARR